MAALNKREVLAWTTTSAVGYQIIAKICSGYMRNNVDSWNVSQKTKDTVKSTLFAQYVISTVNAIQSGAWGLYKFTQGQRRWDNPSGNSQSVVLINGYMLADLLLADNWISDPATVVHHLIGLTSISGLLLGNIGSAFQSDAELMEVSTVFLNIMWFLRTFEKTETKLYKFMSMSFLLLFFITRVVIYPLTLWRVRTQRPAEWAKLNIVLKFLLPGLFVLQLFYFYKILLKVKKQLQ